jgi:hypothetical protein
MEEVQFQLTIDEANLVLAALGNLPFTQVSSLIAKLHTQVNKQMSELNEKKAQPVNENGKEK